MTEPHVGYSKDQIAQAVLDTELDTTATNAVVIIELLRAVAISAISALGVIVANQVGNISDAVEKFRRPVDHRDMHDVYIVISEGADGETIAGTVHAASDDEDWTAADRANECVGQLELWTRTELKAMQDKETEQ